MAVAYGTSSVVAEAVGANTIYTAPASIANGDILLILHFEAAAVGAAPVPTPPAGFVLAPGVWPITQIDGAGSEGDVWLWTKTAASESGNYTVTHASVDRRGMIVRVTGADPSSTITSLTQNHGQSANTTTWLGLTASVDAELILAFGEDWNNAGGTLAAPAGSTPTFTKQIDDNHGNYLATGVLSPAGPTGNQTATNNNTQVGNPFFAVMVAIQPPLPSGGGGGAPLPLFPSAYGRNLNRGVRSKAQMALFLERAPKVALPIVRPAHTTLIGLNNCEGWGASQAATVYGAGIRWNRIELTVGDPVASAAEGFQTLAIAANSANASVITGLSPATQAATAVSQLQTAAPNVQIAEFMNEPYLKGAQAWPVYYGRLYMAALQALQQNGIYLRLLYASTGDYFNEASSASCSFSGSQPVATMTSTDSIYVGQAFSGTNVPGGATVLSIDSATQFTSSANFSGAGPQTLTFASGFSTVDSANGGWVARACLTVPGLAQAIQQNGISLHPYGRPTEDSSGHSNGLAGASHILDRLGTQLGFKVDCYVTEVGFFIDGSAAGQTTGQNCHDMAEQASLIDTELQAVIAETRIKGVWIFQSHNNTGGVGLGWGVMEDGGTQRPSLGYLSAWARAQQQIAASNAPASLQYMWTLRRRGIRNPQQMARYAEEPRYITVAVFKSRLGLLGVG